MKTTNIHINCKDCGINKICLPSMLAESEVAHLDSIIQRNSSTIDKGTHLFNIGDEFKYVYAIRSGAFKTYVVSYSGEEQITAFHLPGELIGLDIINTGIHKSTTVALMESHICKIPYEMLEELSGQIKGLQAQMFRLLSKEISEDQELLLLLGQKHANEKMASLLINLSSRYKVRNLSYDLFMLPMSRGELVNYLGLTIETISRIFKIFKEKEYIEVKGKQIYLKDITALNRMAGIYCQ
jgi:CRP/FNR family transcriptional regulator